ncbi:MAG: hypothetical protein ACOX4D_05740 [Bacteroidales bacterium]|jgi:nucleoid DNA-binding protein
MDITKDIIELLYTSDCVIVPDFGGFILNYQPSHIDTKQNIFIPSKKQLGFNSLLKQDNGLLAHKISTSKNIPYKQAQIEIKNYVDFLNRKLKLKEVVNLIGLGVFYLDNENNLTFKSQEGLNFNEDTIGFSNYYLPSAVAVISKPKQEKSAKVIKLDVKRKLKYTAAAAAIIAFGIFSFKIADYGFQNVYQASVIPLENKSSKNDIRNSENTVKANSEINENLTDNLPKVENTEKTNLIEDIDIEDDIKELSVDNNINSTKSTIDKTSDNIVNTDIIEEAKNRIVEPSAGIQTPYVIVASFPTIEDASIELNRIFNLGYKDVSIIYSNNKYRVTISDKTTSKNLDEVLEDAQKHVNPAAWILFY